MTIGTHSIAEAVSRLESRWRQPSPAASSKESWNRNARNVLTAKPVDVVAVVTSVATLQSPPGVSAVACPRVDIQISDQSIPSSVTATVSLYGSNELSLVAEQQVAPGDIVRFNRLGISRKHRSLRGLGKDRSGTGSAQFSTIKRGAVVKRGDGGRTMNDRSLVTCNSSSSKTAGLSAVIQQRPNKGSNSMEALDCVMTSVSNPPPIYFEHPLDDPEPGWRWYKFGRIQIHDIDQDCNDPGSTSCGYDVTRSNNEVPDTPVEKNYEKQGEARQARLRSAADLLVNQYSDHVGAPRRIPDEMRTAQTRIKELVEWYTAQQSHEQGQNQRGQGDNALEENTMPPPRVGDKRIRSLSPLPCIWRSLAEIQASPGAVSNIRVRVNHCDSQIVPFTPRGHAMKRRIQDSTSLSGLRPLQQRQIVGFATVIDRSDTVLTIVDPGNKFGSFFRRANKDQNKTLVLNNILSRRQSDIYGKLLQVEEVILWPSLRTTASLVSPASTPEKADEQSGDIRETQLSEGGRDQQRYTQVESPIIELCVDGVDVLQCIDESFRYIRECIFSADGSTYKTAIIQLDTSTGEGSSFEKTNQCEQERICKRYYAGSTILNALCGGLSPFEWKQPDGNSNAHQHHRAESVAAGMEIQTLGQNALLFFRSLLREAVVLHWTIDLAHIPFPEIVRVTLPTI